ncbi:MAG: HD domain-containing protein [Clostridia bacterium]|jgi:putative nucleotidyltransferase with HDIG domain|nr:HD domain-containing protein [Clostridia bacterium]
MYYSNRYFSNLYDLVVCMTNAVDLISNEVANHHHQVAYLAYNFAEKLELPIEQKQTLVLSALLHDIGALSLNDRLELIEEEPFTAENHALIGAKLLSDFPLFSDVANVIKFHHIPWDYGKGRLCGGEKVSMLSHILHISDRIAVQVNDKKNIISQIDKIRENIKSRRNTIFMPELVDAFLDICDTESLWLDLIYQPMVSNIPNDLYLEAIKLTLDQVVDLAKIFSRIIDFRSPFTAMHSAGVAAAAEKLAELSGFSKDECKMMRIAGNLHDIGKLAIPQNILEKQDKLEPAEFDIIRGHSFYTYRLLKPIRGFEIITQWAAYHHEKLNGHGYPFHLKADSLSLGSRIMAVADIFTAITEDRPYRKGMSDEKTAAVLSQMVENGSISSSIFSLLMNNYKDIYNIRKESAEKAVEEYSKIISI